MASILGFIIHPMETGLASVALSLNSAVLAVVVFTLLTRLLLSPLQIAQLRNVRAMQRIQPLIDDLRTKHGKDQKKLLEETSALHREHHVHPVLGLMVTVLQIPVLIGLNYALAHLGMAPVGYPRFVSFAGSVCHGIAVHNWSQWFDACYAVSGTVGGNAHIWRLFHTHVLWLSRGLGSPDPLYILPTLAGAMQWVQSRMLLTESADPQQRMVNSLMNLTPLGVIVFAAHVSSGLSLYWVVSALVGILFQYKITGTGLLPSSLRGIRVALSQGRARSGGA